jgi:DMSO/TMAO reductase YedYZ molybdopterin-dependent catalytic subunit
MGCTARKPVSSYSSGDQQYEQQKIVISGDIEKSQEITVAEMRQLPQQELAGSFQRTTGLREEFDACGPSLEDVLARRGINAHDYKGIGFAGQDGYYCLITPEIMQNRTLILALAIDGKNQLARDMRPARLCAQGEFGPYWVRMVNKIILYKEIPKKEISSVWIFNNLVQGIEPYPYEYYGSKDNAIELALILSRFDNVNNRAFFTMKSADGFIKHEALNMVSKDYYIKIAGKDAPMNIAPNIKLGMNVKNIACFLPMQMRRFFLIQ